MTAIIVAAVLRVSGLNNNAPDLGGNPTTLRPTAPSSTGSTGAILPSGSLVRVDSVALEPTGGSRGRGFVFAQPFRPGPAELDSLNATVANELSQGDSSNYDAWFRGRGAAEAGESRIKLVVQGNSSQQVRITDMRVLKQCRSAGGGTLFYSPAAGSDESVRIAFDLDRPDSIPMDSTAGGQSYFDTHSVSLMPNEQEVFEIQAETLRQYCAFRLAITVVGVNGPTQQVVMNGNAPFLVSGVPTGDTGQFVAPIFADAYTGGVESADGLFHEINPTAVPAG